MEDSFDDQIDAAVSGADEIGTEIVRRRLLEGTAVGLFGLAGLSELEAVGASESFTGMDLGSTGDPIGLDVTLVEEDPDAGFNYPYFLYAPAIDAETSARPILVQPNNSGRPSDDFSVHKDAAEQRVTDRFPRELSDDLSVPLLVPVFPRPRSEPKDSTHNVQYLCTTTMRIDSGVLERVDEQLVNMIADAQERLSELSYPVADDILMNGFSSSGNWVNKFTALHPDLVRGVTAGAVNGTPILPREAVAGHTVPYQIGVADFDSLIGDGFDIEAWRDVEQYIWMGGAETAADDTIGFSGTWTEDEQVEVALDVYGRDMQRDRMPFCEAVYHDADATAEFAVYDDLGHRRSQTTNAHVRTFHQRLLDEVSVSFDTAPMIDATSVDVDAVVGKPREGTHTIRIYSDDRGDITADPPTLEPGDVFTASVPLTDAVNPDESLTVAVLDAEADSREDAVATATETATIALEFTETPQAGETTVTLSYTVSESYDETTRLRLFPEDSQWFGLGLDWLDAGADGTETYTLSEDEEGIPLEANTSLTARLFPEDWDDVDDAIAATTVIVEEGDDATETSAALEDTSRTAGGDSSGDDESLSLTFADRPRAGDETVTLDYEVDSNYEDEMLRLRIFPEGGHQWGIGLGWVEGGTRATETFDLVEQARAYQLDGVPLELDSELTAGLFPEDWGDRDDVLLEATSIVGGGTVRIADIPEEGGTEITVTYHLSETNDDTAALRFETDEGASTVLDTLAPGESGTDTYSLDTAEPGVPLERASSITVTLEDEGATDEPIARDSAPVEVADVSFAHQPVAGTGELSVEYALDGAYESSEFVGLRLYTEDGSSWGQLLTTVEPGEETTQTVRLDTIHDDIPFIAGTTLALAVVTRSDPYAESPLARAETVVVTPDEREHPLADYLNDENRIGTAGLRDAIDDWRAGTLGITQLRDAIDYWRSGDPVE